MKTVNSVHLVGAVGKDPEVRFTQGGTAIANFSLATNTRKKNQSGDYSDIVQWHNCVTFGKLAEIVQKYVVKGAKLYVSGTIEYQQWDDQGVTKKATKIVLNELSLISSKQQSANEPPKSENTQTDSSNGYAELDDDIPF